LEHVENECTPGECSFWRQIENVSRRIGPFAKRTNAFGSFLEKNIDPPDEDPPKMNYSIRGANKRFWFFSGKEQDTTDELNLGTNCF
jgi:hypothetical protein